MTTTSADAIRSFVRREYLEPARRRGLSHVRIVAGDVHRSLKLKNRVPNVCQVLDSQKFLEENHLVLEKKEGPPSGMGTRMVFIYRLGDKPGAETSSPSFIKLHGILGKALAALGGGEVFLRRERSHFYDEERENPK